MPLEDPDHLRLRAAPGYIGLGMPLKFLYAILRIAKILEVEENRPLKIKQMPP
jgi:hypothetical protein